MAALNLRCNVARDIPTTSLIISSGHMGAAIMQQTIK